MGPRGWWGVGGRDPHPLREAHSGSGWALAAGLGAASTGGTRPPVAPRTCLSQDPDFWAWVGPRSTGSHKAKDRCRHMCGCMLTHVSDVPVWERVC